MDAVARWPSPPIADRTGARRRSSRGRGMRACGSSSWGGSRAADPPERHGRRVRLAEGPGSRATLLHRGVGEGDAVAQEEDARMCLEPVTRVVADVRVLDPDVAGPVVADEEDGAAALSIGAVVHDLG